MNRDEVIEKMIKWFRDREGNVTYSMTNRTGDKSFDCSSSVYYAICYAMNLEVKYPFSTETEHDFLLANGFEKIADNEIWQSERGDIFILGRKGFSSGAGGHTGIYLDKDRIIHCNYLANGISVDKDRVLDWDNYGWYGYRLKQNEWIKDNIGWIYKDDNGICVKNGWKKIGGNWFYFDEKGYAYQKHWLKYNEKWYWFDENCYMVFDKFVNIGDETFYFNENGVCDLNYLRKIDGKLFAFNERGALIKNKKINEFGVIE